MTRFAPALATALAAAFAFPAAASASSMILANQLGSVLGSEEGCGLAFDQDAIEAWIEANVAADDMGFAGTLGLMSKGQARQIGDMTESERRAHCAQTRRVARSFGFIAE
jgi:energy-converting hydrogenase Eha subunit B